MTKVKLYLRLLLFFSPVAFAQGKLAGLVSEQNTGVKIKGISVKSYGANDILSDSKGYFLLAFQELKPGKNIIVRAEKEGWEIVNEKEMNTLLPDNPNERPFKIILCKTGNLALAKSKYYDTFEQNLQKELDRQKALNKGNDLKIYNLEKDFAKVQKQLYDLADEYSRIDLSQASAKEIEAIELFKAGKYDEFIAVKKSIVTEEEVDKAIKNKKEATLKITNADSTLTLYFKSQKDIANTLKQQFKFDEAEKVFENIVSKDSTNAVNLMSFADYLKDQNQLDKAIQIYQTALRLVKNEDEITKIQNSLGILFSIKNDFVAALNAYQIALELSEQLAKSNPDAYEPKLASIQNNLGNFYSDKKRDFAAALNAYKKALEIRERLAQSNPDTYEPDLASTQNNIGNLYRNKKDFSTALNAYLIALKIREKLAKINPVAYEPQLAGTLSNLGRLYQSKNDYTTALDYYLKSVEIWERLVKNNPASYSPDLALIYYNLGLLYQTNDDISSALNAYGKSLEIREKLAKINPDAYEPDLAKTLNNLGVIYEAKNEYESALNTYGKELEIWKRLAKNNPEAFEIFVASTQTNQGNVYQAKKDYVAALQAFERSLEVYERLAQSNPSTYEIKLADCLLSLCFLQKEDYQEYRQKIVQQYLERVRKILLKYHDETFAKEMLDDVKDLEPFFKTKK